jgi:NAD(P)-dependent dehydrogenase (short-subunit alcohol dehydrogenase family)
VYLNLSSELEKATRSYPVITMTESKSSSSGYDFPGLDNLHKDIYPTIDASKNSDLKQSGKVVLITGAGRGIGRAIALQYAHASAALIVLSARTSTELDEVESAINKINSSVRVQKQKLDVTDTSAVASFAADFGAKEGRLDVLVNNAGASGPWQNVAETDPHDWWSLMEVNLKGPYLILQAFLPLLVATAEKQKTYVNVINTTSIGAVQVSPTGSAYGISKLALQRLSEFVDAEYAGKGVNVVGLHPGGVPTNLSREVEIIKDCKYISRFWV